jgi:hypothetical protein
MKSGELRDTKSPTLGLSEPNRGSNLPANVDRGLAVETADDSPDHHQTELLRTLLPAFGWNRETMAVPSRI